MGRDLYLVQGVAWVKVLGASSRDGLFEDSESRAVSEARGSFSTVEFSLDGLDNVDRWVAAPGGRCTEAKWREERT